MIDVRSVVEVGWYELHPSIGRQITIALETGDADSATWPLLVEDSVRLRDEEEGFIVFSTPANSVKHFPINNSLPQLSDKRVRQALLMALDRQRIIDDLWNDFDERFESNEEATDPANPLPILDPSRRSGLTREHPFVQKLFREALKHLRPNSPHTCWRL